MKDQVTSLWSQIHEWLPIIVSYTSRIVMAIIVLCIGWFIINVVTRTLARMMTASHVEPTLREFLNSVASLLLKALLLISVASMVGIATTSFVAVLGAAGLAVGMALQGSLANFAGGVLILLFRPFKIGDSITAGGNTGTVVSIEMFRTIIRDATNALIYVPNGTLSNNIIANNTQGQRRLACVTLLIDYNDDTDKAREILINLLKDDNQILDLQSAGVSFDPKPANIAVSLEFWCAASNRVGLVAKYSEAAIKALKQEGYRLGVTTRPSGQ